VSGKFDSLLPSYKKVFIVKHRLQSKGYNPETVTSAEIEREYWRIIQTGAEEMDVEYANDLDTTEVGSGFLRPLHKSFSAFDSAQKKGQKESINFQDPEYYRTTGWNLNNLPRAYGSLLRHIQTDIKGINVPWLYCGMLFATFCWHTEDNYMYSINYQHYGAKKRWYGVPASHSSAFEKALMSHVPERFQENPDLLFHVSMNFYRCTEIHPNMTCCVCNMSAICCL
jgi:histone demethylase JARID1